MGGWLGSEPPDLSPDLARACHLSEEDGVIVASVLKGGPAWNAGIRVGDIVREIDGQTVYDTVGFLNQIAPKPPGDDVMLTILSAGRTRKVQAKVGVRPPIRRPYPTDRKSTRLNSSH